MSAAADAACTGRRPWPPMFAVVSAALAVLAVLALDPLVVPDLVLAAVGEDRVAAAEQAHQQALAAYAEADAEVSRAEEHRRGLDVEAARREVSLRELDAATLQRVLAYETTIRRARDLAVDAYVRGGRQSELAVLLGSAQNDEALVRGQLLAGGVDQARDAAATLQSERVSLDRQVAEVGADVAGLRRQLDLADRAVATALTNRRHAYEAVLAAINRLAEVVAEASAEAAALAEARRAAEAAAARGSADSEPADSEPTDDPGASDQSPPARSDESSSPVPQPPPPPPPPASDAKAEAWAKLRECESGGNYQAIGGGGLYRGAYQFSQATWQSVGGTGDPAAASPAEQDYRARLLYERSGSGQWPLCGRFLDEA